MVAVPFGRPTLPSLIVDSKMTAMALDIRPAELKDVPIVLGLIRGLAEYENLLHEFEASEERIRAAFFPKEGKPAAECVLAWEGGDAVGFAVFFTTFSTFLAKPGVYLEDIFVRPEMRKRGIGRKLLLHVARLANERGCGRMEWTVLDWNKPALEFYASIGAKRLDEWRICRLTGADLARWGGGEPRY